MAPSEKMHWKSRLHEIIFESNTNAGKAFDIALLISILASIAIVMADSVPVLHKKIWICFLHTRMEFHHLIYGGICVAPGNCEKPTPICSKLFRYH